MLRQYPNITHFFSFAYANNRDSWNSFRIGSITTIAINSLLLAVVLKRANGADGALAAGIFAGPAASAVGSPNGKTRGSAKAWTPT